MHPSLAFAPRKPAAAAGLSHAARSLGDARGERQPLDLSRGVTNRPRRRPATPSSSNTTHPTGCSSCNPRPVIRPFPPLTRPWLGGSFIYRGLTLDVMTLALTSPERMTTTNRAGSGHRWSGHRVALFFFLFFFCTELRCSGSPPTPPRQQSRSMPVQPQTNEAGRPWLGGGLPAPFSGGRPWPLALLDPCRGARAGLDPASASLFSAVAARLWPSRFW